MSEFFKEPRDKIYEKGVIEFYNDLAFMKDKSRYDCELAEKQMIANEHSG